jgi:hypothetical protein
MAIFKGAGVAIITPFNEDGSVNYDKFGEFIEEQIRRLHRCDHRVRNDRRGSDTYGGRASESDKVLRG